MTSRIFAPKHSTSLENGQLTAFYILAALFCTGAISALIFDETPGMTGAYTEARGFEEQFLPAIRIIQYVSFHFAAFFLGSSFLGCFLLPIVTGAFGYYYYHMSEAVLCLEMNTDAFIKLAALLLLAPCFFTIAVDAFGASMKLRNLLSCCSIKTDRNRLTRSMLCVAVAVAATVIFLFINLF